MELIESAPELHRVVWENVRAARLRKFRYIVYYLIYEDRVEVLAVMHGARDSAAWHSHIRLSLPNLVSARTPALEGASLEYSRWQPARFPPEPSLLPGWRTTSPRISVLRHRA